jgi:hypothetical protein
MGTEMAGIISAPTLFVLKLSVALARVPGKIAIRQKAVAHGWCQTDTKWQVQRPKRRVASVF